MITFNSIYPAKNQNNVGVNEDIKINISADFELDPRDVVFKIHGVEIVPEIYSVYYGDSTSDLEITLYTKRRVKYATERRYGQDDFRYGMRDVYPSMFNYGSRYVVEVLVFGLNMNNEYEEQKEVFSFSIEDGIFYNQNPPSYFYSPMTQAIANYYPSWSKTRYDKYSNIQQLVNPLGEKLEKITDFLSKQYSNSFIQTANLNELSTLHRVELGKDYPVKELVSEAGNSYYVQPDITAIQDITKYDLFAEPNNSFQDFYYNKMPTRLDSEREVMSDQDICRDLQIGSVKTYINYSLVNARELYLICSGINSSIIKEGNFIRLLKVRINGKDNYDDDVSEDIVALLERPLQTKKEWKEVYSVELIDARDETLNLTICTVPERLSITKDFKRHIGTEDKQEQVYWGMTERDGSSVLEKRIERGNNLIETLRNGGVTDVVQEYHLKDIDGYRNVKLIDFTLDPFSNFIYGIDEEYLYLYDKREEYSKRVKELSGSNGDSDLMIEMEQDDLGLDEGQTKEVLFKVIHGRPGNTIIKYRIIVKQPDGSVFYIKNDNSITTDKNEATIYANQNDVALDPKQYSVTLNQSGEYLFELEALYRGGKTSYHQQIYQIKEKAALAKYKLERIMNGATPLSISYHKDQKIKIYDDKNVLNSLVLRKDGVMIDYNDKILYFIEDYDSIGVEN